MRPDVPLSRLIATAMRLAEVSENRIKFIYLFIYLLFLNLSICLSVHLPVLFFPFPYFFYPSLCCPFSSLSLFPFGYPSSRSLIIIINIHLSIYLHTFIHQSSFPLTLCASLHLSLFFSNTHLSYFFVYIPSHDYLEFSDILNTKTSLLASYFSCLHF